jgi:hypothetical protein
VCRKKKAINELKPENGGKLEPPQSEDDEASGLYHINIFQITETSQQQATPKGRTKPRDFKAQLVVNNSLAAVLADTGASISVCGKEQACKWNLLTRMINTNAKIKPYNSPTTALQQPYNTSPWNCQVRSNIRRNIDTRRLAHHRQPMRARTSRTKCRATWDNQVREPI